MNATFQNLSFKNVGNDRANNGRRINGGLRAMKTATKRTGTTVGPSTTVVPITDKIAMTAAFSAVVLPFENGELAQWGKCGKEAAKKWKAARSLPSFWTMANLARENPVIRDWVLARLNVNPDFNSPQFMTMAASAMYQLAHQRDEAGEAMRELIAQLAKKNGRR